MLVVGRLFLNILFTDVKIMLKLAKKIRLRDSLSSFM